MKILIICAADRSKHFIALNIIKYLSKLKLDKLNVYVLDRNKNIISFLKKNDINHIKNNKNFFNFIKKNEYDWLLNIWGYKIFKKNFLSKFKQNLNLHPSFLPYNKGSDPYYFSLINQTPIGITIHEMDEKIDNGKY